MIPHSVQKATMSSYVYINSIYYNHDCISLWAVMAWRGEMNGCRVDWSRPPFI